MKILWLINIPLPEASLLLGEKPLPFGGWLINASKRLSAQKDIELSIAFPSIKPTKLKKLKGEWINYFPFDSVKANDLKNNKSLEKILEEVNPDIVHIYGTEMRHTLAMVNICKNRGVKSIISIQGLVSVYAKHMYANLPFYVIYGFSLRNILRRDSIYGQKKFFELKGKDEIEALQNVNHIIGRTTWDKACSQQINPKAKYHFCNETLREEFYNHQWNINECEKYSIFLSQGQYSIKGLHYVLEAMPIILKNFPEAKVYISGKDITKSNSFKDRLLITYYGKYIRKTIKRLDLKDSVIFTGPLDEKTMCQRYLKSNVFVCPSSIENSPNSLGEAMILGVPCIASDVGGVSDMLKHQEEGFVYQTDATYMLAYYICEIFKNKEVALKFSKNAREHALKTHNSNENTRNLLDIYIDILYNA